MRNRQFPGWRSPVVALASLTGGVLIVLAAAVPALAASAGTTTTGPATPLPAVSASASVSLPAGPSLGIGTAISTSRRPPASALATLGVDAASDSASQVQAATTAPALLPTGVNAGHGTSSGVPAISEFGGAAAVALLVGGLLGYRRRTGAHRV